jgi:hypothetical protein
MGSDGKRFEALPGKRKALLMMESSRQLASDSHRGRVGNLILIPGLGYLFKPISIGYANFNLKLLNCTL